MTENTNESSSKILKIKGKLVWAKLFAPDTAYTHRWMTDVLLDAEGLKLAKENSLRVKKLDKNGKAKYEGMFDGYDGSYIQVTRDCKDRSGADREPPAVIDGDLRAVPSSVGIGNGTDAYIRCLVKTNDMSGAPMTPAVAMKKHGGYGLMLLGVQILNLVPYERRGDPEKDFVADDSASFKYGSESGGFDFENGDELPFDKDITAAG